MIEVVVQYKFDAVSW